MKISEKIKRKTIEKTADKLASNIPALETIAVYNDKAFYRLIDVIKKINQKRKSKNKDYFELVFKGKIDTD